MRRVLSAFLKATGVTIAVIVALAIIDLVVVQGIGRPIRWEIPAGYQGWVEVQYDNPACPPLKDDGLYLVVTIPVSGHACTSTPPLMGWRFNRYEYVGSNGTRTKIPTSGLGGGRELWAVADTPRQANAPFPGTHFFVGSEAALEKNWITEPHP
ncbi:MAG: DUF6843 domain-containing protein [Candidatus Dormibacteraceae bacterium]